MKWQAGRLNPKNSKRPPACERQAALSKGRFLTAGFLEPVGAAGVLAVHIDYPSPVWIKLLS